MIDKQNTTVCVVSVKIILLCSFHVFQHKATTNVDSKPILLPRTCPRYQMSSFTVKLRWIPIEAALLHQKSNENMHVSNRCEIFSLSPPHSVQIPRLVHPLRCRLGHVRSASFDASHKNALTFGRHLVPHTTFQFFILNPTSTKCRYVDLTKKVPPFSHLHFGRSSSDGMCDNVSIIFLISFIYFLSISDSLFTAATFHLYFTRLC